jgi:hypothetical protein
MRLGFKAKVALDALFTFRVLFTYVVIVGCIVFWAGAQSCILQC